MGRSVESLIGVQSEKSHNITLYLKRGGGKKDAAYISLPYRLESCAAVH